MSLKSIPLLTLNNEISKTTTNILAPCVFLSILVSSELFEGLFCFHGRGGGLLQYEMDRVLAFWSKV